MKRHVITVIATARRGQAEGLINLLLFSDLRLNLYDQMVFLFIDLQFSQA